MNQRIQELIQQATRVIEPDDPDYRQEIFDKKLFARLIVQECADIAKHNVMNISTYADAEFVDTQIKQHFGVEE